MEGQDQTRRDICEIDSSSEWKPAVFSKGLLRKVRTLLEECFSWTRFTRANIDMKRRWCEWVCRWMQSSSLREQSLFEAVQSASYSPCVYWAVLILGPRLRCRWGSTKGWKGRKQDGKEEEAREEDWRKLRLQSIWSMISAKKGKAAKRVWSSSPRRSIRAWSEGNLLSQALLSSHRQIQSLPEIWLLWWLCLLESQWESIIDLDIVQITVCLRKLWTMIRLTLGVLVLSLPRRGPLQLIDQLWISLLWVEEEA